MPRDTSIKYSSAAIQALAATRRDLALHVYDAARLEGVLFTYPEVQTILQGVTVGGKNIEDHKLVERLGRAYKELFTMVEEGTFAVNKETACHLHAVVAEHEAMTWGEFRTGNVNIHGATAWTPPDHTLLGGLWEECMARFNSCPPEAERAYTLFLEMCRNQFFYDANKRTARIMMNGALIVQGQKGLTIPEKRLLEFNEAMIRFYDSGDMKEMLRFLAECAAGYGT